MVTNKAVTYISSSRQTRHEWTDERTDNVQISVSLRLCETINVMFHTLSHEDLCRCRSDPDNNVWCMLFISVSQSINMSFSLLMGWLFTRKLPQLVLDILDVTEVSLSSKDFDNSKFFLPKLIYQLFEGNRILF